MEIMSLQTLEYSIHYCKQQKTSEYLLFFLESFWRLLLHSLVEGDPLSWVQLAF